MPRPPRDAERDRLLAQQSPAVVKAAQEMEALVERLLNTALSLPT